MRCLFFHLFLFTILIVSCKSSHSILGQYKSRSTISTTILTLDSAKKFTYNSYAEMIHIFSEGVWWNLKDTLYLKSSDDLTIKNGSVTETYVDTIPGLTIFKFFDKGGDKLENVEIVINGNDTVVSNKDGLIKYDKPVNFIFLRLYSNYDFFYRKKSDKSNLLDFYVQPIDNVNKYFTLEKFQVKGKKLISPIDEFIKQ